MMNLTSFIDKKKLSKILREFVSHADEERRKIDDAIATLDSIDRAAEAKASLASSVGAAHQYLSRVTSRKSLFSRAAKGAVDTPSAAQLLVAIEKDFGSVLGAIEQDVKIEGDGAALASYNLFLRTLVSFQMEITSNRTRMFWTV